MIKVNLAGIEREKPKPLKSTGPKIAMPANFSPVLLIAIVVGFAASGFWLYWSMTSQSAALDKQIRELEARKAALDAVIKQDQVYESVKKKLENRVRIVESLAKNQVSPILALDQLAGAIQKTRYVWLSSLEQKDALLSMNGTGTSLNAIADFYTNLNATGYFKNVDLGTAQENAGNYTFSLKCEFTPPRRPARNTPSPTAGGN